MNFTEWLCWRFPAKSRPLNRPWREREAAYQRDYWRNVRYPKILAARAAKEANG
jgi:hypothetical protein